ncbi:MAG: hypothetical protein TREMPRED_002441 [Tremellales sp. Tagirdzhanova-0007]|nr:MAG: hypothetical protein TREMPRED_002441 [Tremellales sp. Tagirdzhanova-0007]
MSSSQTRKRSSRLESQQEAIVDSAKRQLQEVGTTAQDAVTSGVWAYPVLGIYYLLTHPSLLQPLLPTLAKGILMSIVVVVAMFGLTYLPQVAVLAFISGPLAFIAAIPLVLGEAYVVVNFVARTFLLGQVGIDLFDAVLVEKGQTTLVERGRQVTSSGGKTKQLGNILTKPLSRFSTDSLVRYVLSLPLNLIPVVGTVFFVGYNGLKAGPGYHARYFQLKGYDKDKRQNAIKKRRGAYTAFGVVAIVLNLVPIASIFFAFTTSVGAALWAADIESMAKGDPARELSGEANSAKSAEAIEVVMPPREGRKEL